MARRFSLASVLLVVAALVPLFASPSEAGNACVARTNAPNGGTTGFFAPATGSDDGRVWGHSHSVYPPPGTEVAVGANQLLVSRSHYRKPKGTYFHISTTLIRFDTTGLPEGSTPLSAYLCVYVNAVRDADNRSLTGEWYPSSKWPIDTSDYSRTAQTSALASAPLSGITAGGYRVIDLDNVDGVVPGGFTGIRLHISGGKPHGRNYLYIRALESESAPVLAVTYTGGG